jgi:hypothetical protein
MFPSSSLARLCLAFQWRVNRHTCDDVLLNHEYMCGRGRGVLGILSVVASRRTPAACTNKRKEQTVTCSAGRYVSISHLSSIHFHTRQKVSTRDVHLEWTITSSSSAAMAPPHATPSPSTSSGRICAVLRPPRHAWPIHDRARTLHPSCPLRGGQSQCRCNNSRRRALSWRS